MIGKELATRGVVGFFAVDFLTVERKDGYLDIFGIEINLRQGGTTHPLQTAKRVTGAKYDEESGLLKTPSGQVVRYRSNDNFASDELVGKEPQAFVSHLSDSGALFNPHTGRGIVLHMLNSLREFGKIGYVAIGSTEREIAEIEKRFQLAVSDFID